MNFENLHHQHEDLISYMEKNEYSKSYIDKFKSVINWILKNSETKTFNSYADIYQEYQKIPHTENYLRNIRGIIGAIEQYDISGNYPNGRRRHTLFPRGSYHLLTLEFQQLIDFYQKEEMKRGKKESTIHGEALNIASFLYVMQKQGCNSLETISEDSVLSFFLSPTNELVKSCSYKKNISAVFKAGITWNEKECKRILSCLPILRDKRKNIQYLTTEEVATFRGLFENADNILSFRNRAIGILLLYTGLRGCDIAALKLNSIDWENEKIAINQQKTEEPLELPLLPVVGNAIYDYIISERPNAEEEYLFLTELKPYTPLAKGSVGSIATKIFRIAKVRQSVGNRKGTHIFRHNLATTLLEKGISQPVISKTLGHISPNSLEIYLRADFVHLKECAISIEDFLVGEEVFSL